MAVVLFANNAGSTVAGAITSVATTVTLATGTGALFPSPGANQYFCATFVDAATGLINEIVHVTGMSGDIATIVRGQEGTTPQNWAAGDFFNNFWTAGSAAAMLQQGQSQQQSTNFAIDTGGVNAMVITLSPVPTAMSALVGAPLRVQVAVTNTAATPTLNVNGLGAFNVVTMGTAGVGILGIGTAAASKIIDLIWDGTNFQYQDRLVTASAAQIAAGTDVVSPITSAGLAAAMPITAFTTSAGSQKLPSGMIIQWGTYTSATGSNDTFALPTTFPTHGVAIIAAPFNSTSEYTVNSGFSNNSTALVSTLLAGTPTASVPIHWIAIGY